MFCRKCGKKIKDIMSFCPYCGAEVSAQVSPSANDTAETSPRNNHNIFSYKTVLILTIGVVLLSLILLRIFPITKTKYDWKDIICTDLLSGTSKIEKAITEAIDISIKEEKDYISVTVIAPDICDELLDWMIKKPEADYNETQMEDEILRLLNTVDTVETTHKLIYIDENGTISIKYTQEFGDTISCGLARFYNELSKRILEELGGKAQ